MTRKDYILIAGALSTAREAMEATQPTSFVGAAYDNLFARVLWEVANELEHDNPNFVRKHFVAVCRGEKSLTSRPAR